MSKTTIIGFVVLLIICVLASFYFIKPKISQEKELITTSEVKNILLYIESGDVSFKSTGAETFQKATTSPIIIPNQTVVHTDIGLASVLLPDNSTISLDNNSEIIVNYTKKKISIYQSFGATYHRVEALFSGKSYEVQTAGTLAAVRGTKFAVKYNLKTKKTKVAVTENKVQVSTIPMVTGTTTAPLEESILLEAGKTVSVETVVAPSKEKSSAIKVVDTKNDNEMTVWVDSNKNRDTKLDEIKEVIKKEEKDVRELRRQIKKFLFNDESDDSSSKDIKEQTILKREETRSDKPTQEAVKINGTITKTTQENSIVNTGTIAPVIKKIGEEEFFNTFNDLYTKYFYLDDVDSTCSLKITPEQRLNIINSYATAAVYPIKSTTLLSFAKAIDSYCSQKDGQTKVRLQTRFDDEFPFKENI